MDAREQLRRCLEQRREFGESDLQLDGLSVDEALRLLGAERPADAGPLRERAARETAPETPADWRDALSRAGARPSAPEPPLARPPDEARASVAEIRPVPPGLVVGTSSRELFGDAEPRFASLGEIAAAVKACTDCALHATA